MLHINEITNYRKRNQRLVHYLPIVTQLACDGEISKTKFCVCSKPLGSQKHLLGPYHDSISEFVA